MDIPQGLFDYITNSLIPVNCLPEDRQKILLENAVIETHEVGAYLFQQGDVDDNVYYLLSGKINMMATDESSFTIDTNVEQCLYPIGQMQPRQYSAYILQPSQTLTISKSLFDTLLESENTEPSIELDDITDTGCDWMTQLLQSRIFTSIPPQNIQRIFELFEEVSVKENDRIINQNDEGDYFYIIRSGRFEVTRRMDKQNKTFKLATLREGDSFGEESLLGDMPRNASVTAISDGILMRITKESFITLIRDPVIRDHDLDKATQLVEKGGIWLDVRSREEHNRDKIDGSLNLPLNTLRIQMNKLDMESKYVVFCDNGARSTIAAYLLMSKGYTVSHLEGGIMKYQGKLNREAVKIEDRDNENIEQHVSDRKGKGALARQQQELLETEAKVQSLLSRHSDNDQLSIALKTVMKSLFRQLEQALRDKAEAEHAKNIAEQKLEALYVQIDNPNQCGQLRLI